MSPTLYRGSWLNVCLSNPTYLTAPLYRLMQKLLDVQDFLRLPRMNLTGRQVKIHKGVLSEQVANWDDVQKTLNGTEFENFLHDDYRL